MIEDTYYIKISPETILGDLSSQPYTGSPTVFKTITGDPYSCCVITGTSINTIYPTGTTGYYLSMAQVLSGGTNGTSLLTGLTIPILFRETAIDIGYYSVFDGAILQKNVVTNFVFSATTGTPNTYYFYNTSEQEFKNFLQLSSYSVNWGDGTLPQIITTTSPNFISHTYGNNGTYTITLSQTNPWGINTIKKEVVVPFTSGVIQNPNGTAYFTSNVGSWSATPISYDFIFTGDSVNIVNAQTSNNYVSVPFLISGYTNSRLGELKQYGANSYVPFKWVVKENMNWGQITTQLNLSYTGYTIEGIQYLDFTDGTSVYVLNSSGLTSNWMVQEPIVKDESLLNIVYQPEVQSNIFVERGKNSALERVERIGEIDNLGDLVKYGYGFFNVVYQERLG